MRRHILIALAGLVCLSACKSQRVGELKTQNRTLLREVKKSDSADDNYSQRKCADDAHNWFRGGLATNGNDAILLDSWSHNAESEGKCYARVERFFRSGIGSSWGHEVALWSITDNSRIANLSEEHYTPTVSSPNPASNVVTCEVNGKRCTTQGEFRSLTESYMPDR
jgi:hypothetical protein